MKTFTTKLMTALTIGSVAFAASSVRACGKGGKGGGGGYGGGFGSGFGGVYVGNNGGYNNNNRTNQTCNTGGYNQNGGVYGGQAYEPFHSTYIVQPGDSFYTVSLKEYGTSANSLKIAQFNRLPSNSALVPGQRLVLPSISANGQLSQSRSPAGLGDTTPVQFPSTTSTAKFAPTQPTVTVSEPLPVIAAGSLVTLDGQTFGNDKGTVRLNVSGTMLPVEIVEWTLNSTKVRLPLANVASATKAELEVVRADGTLASKSAIELTPATTGLALGN